MFIKVKLLNGFHESLWYKKPDTWKTSSLIGSIVRVPLRTQHIPALVIYESIKEPAVNFEIKLAESIEPIPQDSTYQKFIAQLSTYYQVSPLHLVKRIRSFVYQKEQKQPAPGDQDDRIRKNTNLTPEQQHIVDSIRPSITTPHYMPSLIHGVTSSGKTEIYKELIKTTIQENKSALFLLPEVTLAIEFEKRLRKELPSEMVIISFHSGTAIKQKRLLWQRLLNNEPTLIIGVHIPILLPIPHLGLIIIDEEHDVGYQEKKHPKINSKEAAIWRANLGHIPIVLGSATPSISSLYNVKKRNWHFFQLKTRFAGALPTIKTVLLKEDKNKRKQFWISNELKQAITDRLAKKEQVIIFLNRRGYSFFVQCRACNFIPECPSCSVSLTLHNTNTLNCHYCEYGILLPEKCTTCKKDKFLKKGIGTQQIVSILEEMFINAKIARADLDTTTQKKQWQQIMTDFSNGEINILVGTQTITKGYHFPNVTLVGIIWADLNLHFPIFNAAETTLQQIIQVAGRAGRQSDESLVIVQTMAEHPIFSYLNEIDYLQFYQSELETRSMIGYPPCKRLVEIELKHTNEHTIEKEAHAFACALIACADKTIQVLGPAKPPVHKIKNIFSRKIYLRSEEMSGMIRLFNTADFTIYESSIFFTPNPVN